MNGVKYDMMDNHIPVDSVIIWKIYSSPEDDTLTSKLDGTLFL